MSLDALSTFERVATAGYYLALRVGFAFPEEEVNALPKDWIEHYTHERLMLHDPVIRWVYGHTGAVRWCDIPFSDPRDVLATAQRFGLRHGVAVSCYDAAFGASRTFGSFARDDRAFHDSEITELVNLIGRLHMNPVSEGTLTEAEREALGMVKSGLRVKEIAHQLGVSEGAIKQRLSNAKRKLGAKTGAQAAAMASDRGYI